MTIELTVGLSVDEYLDRSFDPKCELLGGETRPKPFGTGKHSKMQRRLLRLLEGVFGEGRVEFELSVRIGDEVPVPDLVVLQSHNPRMYRDVLDEPPLICIEVVSPSQLTAEMSPNASATTISGFRTAGLSTLSSRGRGNTTGALSHAKSLARSPGLAFSPCRVSSEHRERNSSGGGSFFQQRWGCCRVAM
jgi:hypothetical protein